MVSTPPPAASTRRLLILIAQLGHGGAERQVHELATRLDRRKFLPLVATFEPKGHYQPLLESAGVEVVVLDKRSWREATLPFRLAALIRRRRIDLVHAFLFPANWRAVVAAHLAGGRVICSVRSTGVWMNGRHRWMERRTLPRAGAVVVNAPVLRRELIERAGVDPRRLRVIMNGVDTAAFHPGAARNGRRPTVGFVGSLREAKDPALFVRMAGAIAARRPDARFVMVGDGPLRGSLESLARETGVQDRLVLTGERPDVAEMLRTFDVLAVTSVREGCCNAILEAMATGVPVAATAVGGNPDLIDDGVSGRLFPHGDIEAGAGAVLSLLGGELAGRVVAAALERVRSELSVDAMVGATTALYESLA